MWQKEKVGIFRHDSDVAFCHCRSQFTLARQIYYYSRDVVQICRFTRDVIFLPWCIFPVLLTFCFCYTWRHIRKYFFVHALHTFKELFTYYCYIQRTLFEQLVRGWVGLAVLWTTNEIENLGNHLIATMKRLCVVLKTSSAIRNVCWFTKLLYIPLCGIAWGNFLDWRSHAPPWTSFSFRSFLFFLNVYAKNEI